MIVRYFCCSVFGLVMTTACGADSAGGSGCAEDGLPADCKEVNRSDTIKPPKYGATSFTTGVATGRSQFQP